MMLASVTLRRLDVGETIKSPRSSPLCLCAQAAFQPSENQSHLLYLMSQARPRT
jgi:hypothetical protein